MVGSPFTQPSQSVPLDCFCEQNENLYNTAEYILPAQVHRLYSHSPPQSNPERETDLCIYGDSRSASTGTFPETRTGEVIQNMEQLMLLPMQQTLPQNKETNLPDSWIQVTQINPDMQIHLHLLVGVSYCNAPPAWTAVLYKTQ